MGESTAILTVNTGDGERRVALDDYLDGEAAERAEHEANAWIKSLRHLPVDGQPLRDRFLVRGDSLWWFAELYLHKRRVVTDILRTISALDALVARERPLAIGVHEGDAVAVHLARACAAKRQLMWSGAPSPRRSWWKRRLDPVARGALYTLAAFVDRFKPGRRRVQTGSTVTVAAFVHSAFWRPATDDESYIGPVLREVSRLAGPEQLALVGLGPVTNFKSRTWRQRFSEFVAPPSATPFNPVARYASGRSLAESSRVWSERNANRDALLASAGAARGVRLPRLRCLAAAPRRVHGHHSPAVPLVRPRHGRDRRGARRAPAEGRHHVRRSGRFGEGAGPGGTAAARPRGRPAARVHLPALAQLPARTRRNGAVARKPGRFRFPSSGPDAPVRSVCCQAPHRSGPFPARKPVGCGKPQARCLRRGGTLDG